jgi:dienelactone hydrolase
VKWLAEVQSPPKSLPDNTPSLRPLWESPPSKDQWAKQREAIRQQWLEFLGPLASAERGPAPKLTVLKEDRTDGVVRQLVEYEVEQGEKTQAYLLKPEKLSGKTAGVAVFHSTVNHSILQPAGLGSDAEKAFGLRLAKQGYVTFCPRNFLWPTNDKIGTNEETARFQKRHGDAKGMAKMLYDSLVAVDILAAQPEVDANRIGSIGHSLGAKEVLYLAAFDERVKVTISSEGGIGTAFSNWEAPWYLGPSIHGDAFTGEHHELLALIAPRPFLLVGGDSADGDRSWPFIAAALGVYRLYDEKSQPIGLYNHKKGHAVPPEELGRIDDWFAAYLPPGATKE